MPLNSDPTNRKSHVDLLSVRFPMFDGEKLVHCIVTAAALEDLAAPHGRHLEPIDVLFNSYRHEAEAIASRKV